MERDALERNLQRLHDAMTQEARTFTRTSILGFLATEVAALRPEVGAGDQAWFDGRVRRLREQAWNIAATL